MTSPQQSTACHCYDIFFSTLMAPFELVHSPMPPLQPQSIIQHHYQSRSEVLSLLTQLYQRYTATTCPTCTKQSINAHTLDTNHDTHYFDHLATSYYGWLLFVNISTPYTNYFLKFIIQTLLLVEHEYYQHYNFPPLSFFSNLYHNNDDPTMTYHNIINQQITLPFDQHNHIISMLISLGYILYFFIQKNVITFLQYLYTIDTTTFTNSNDKIYPSTRMNITLSQLINVSTLTEIKLKMTELMTLIPNQLNNTIFESENQQCGIFFHYLNDILSIINTIPCATIHLAQQQQQQKHFQDTDLSSYKSPNNLNSHTQDHFSPLFVIMSLTAYPFVMQFNNILIELLLLCKSLYTATAPIAAHNEVIQRLEHFQKTNGSNNNEEEIDYRDINHISLFNRNDENHIQNTRNTANIINDDDEPILVKSFKLKMKAKVSKQINIPTLQPFCTTFQIEDEPSQQQPSDLDILHCLIAGEFCDTQTKLTANTTNIALSYQKEHLIDAKEYEIYQQKQHDKKLASASVLTTDSTRESKNFDQHDDESVLDGGDVIKTIPTKLKTITPTLPQYPWEQTLLLNIPHNTMVIAIQLKRLLLSCVEYVYYEDVPENDPNVPQNGSITQSDFAKLSTFLIVTLIKNGLPSGPQNNENIINNQAKAQAFGLIYRHIITKHYNNDDIAPPISLYSILSYTNSTILNIHFLRTFVLYLWTNFSTSTCHISQDDSLNITNPVYSTHLVILYHFLQPLIKHYNLTIAKTENTKFVKISPLLGAENTTNMNEKYLQHYNIVQPKEESLTNKTTQLATARLKLPPLSSISEYLYYVKCNKLYCNCPVYNHLHIQQYYPYENNAQNRSREDAFFQLFQQHYNLQPPQQQFQQDSVKNTRESENVMKDDESTSNQGDSLEFSPILVNSDDSAKCTTNIPNSESISDPNDTRSFISTQSSQSIQTSPQPPLTSSTTIIAQELIPNTVCYQSPPQQESQNQQQNEQKSLNKPSLLHALYTPMTTLSITHQSSYYTHFNFLYTQLISPQCTSHHIQTLTTKQKQETGSSSNKAKMQQTARATGSHSSQPSTLHHGGIKDVENVRQDIVHDNKLDEYLTYSQQQQYLDQIAANESTFQTHQQTILTYINGLGQYYQPFFALMTLSPQYTSALTFLQYVQFILFNKNIKLKQELFVRLLFRYCIGSVDSIYYYLYVYKQHAPRWDLFSQSVEVFYKENPFFDVNFNYYTTIHDVDNYDEGMYILSEKMGATAKLKVLNQKKTQNTKKTAKLTTTVSFIDILQHFNKFIIHDITTIAPNPSHPQIDMKYKYLAPLYKLIPSFTQYLSQRQAIDKSIDNNIQHTNPAYNTHLPFSGDIISQYKAAIYHADNTVLNKNNSIQSHTTILRQSILYTIFNILSHFHTTLYKHSIFATFYNNISTPTLSFFRYYYRSKQSKMAALAQWEKDQMQLSHTYNISLHEHDLMEWNKYIMTLASKHEKAMQLKKDQARKEQLLSFYQQRFEGQKENMNNKKEQLINDLVDQVRKEKNNVVLTACSDKKLNDFDNTIQKCDENKSEKLNPSGAQHQVSTDDNNRLTFILKIQRCLTSEEKEWIAEQIKREKERQIIANTQPIFKFNFNGFEVDINQGNMLQNDDIAEAINAHMGDIGMDNDDINTYSFWKQHEIKTLADLRDILQAKNGTNLADITHLYNDQDNNSPDENSQDIVLTLKNIQQRFEKLDINIPLANGTGDANTSKEELLRQQYNFLYVKLEVDVTSQQYLESICLDAHNSYNNDNIPVIEAHNLLHSRFLYTLDIFKSLSLQTILPNQNHIKSNEMLFNYTLQILTHNEIKTLLDIEYKIKQQLAQLNKYNTDDDTAVTLNYLYHKVFPDTNYLGIVQFDEINPIFSCLIQQCVSKSMLYGLHHDIIAYSLITANKGGKNTLFHKPDISSTEFIKPQTQKVPLSMHFDEDADISHQYSHQDDIDRQEGTKKYSMEGLDQEMLHQLFLQTQEELHKAGAFEQKELEEEVSKLQFE